MNSTEKEILSTLKMGVEKAPLVLAIRTLLLLRSFKYQRQDLFKCHTLAKANKAISLEVSATIVVALVTTIGFGVYFTVTLNTTSNQSTPSQRQYAYTSDINSSSPCTYSLGGNSTVASPSISSESASRIISNIENYPEFISLEGNRTYKFEGFGCSGGRNPTGNGTMTHQSEITFSYYDLAHPIYYQCPGNQTVSTPPDYQIVVTLALTPMGYNLTDSNFTSGLFPPFYSCMNPNFNPINPTS